MKKNVFNFSRKLVNQNAFMIFALIIALISTNNAQQTSSTRTTDGIVSGKVTDSLGGLVSGATVLVTDANGRERQTQSNGERLFVLANLPAGKYSGRVAATGFTNYEFADIEVTSGKRITLDVTLTITTVNEQVTVAAEQPDRHERRHSVHGATIVCNGS